MLKQVESLKVVGLNSAFKDPSKYNFSDMSSKKILVIEDDEALSFVLSRILQPKYEVIIINNGMDAITWLTNGNFPNLIISDIHMPQLNGIELLQYLQHSGILKDIPVIILS